MGLEAASVGGDPAAGSPAARLVGGLVGESPGNDGGTYDWTWNEFKSPTKFGVG